MITVSAENRLILAFLASAAAHLIVGLLIIFFLGDMPEKTQIISFEEQRFELENLSEQQIQKIRQAGVRGGTGEGFSAPIPQQQKENDGPQDKPAQAANRQVDFGDLSPGQTTPDVKKQTLTQKSANLNSAGVEKKTDLSLRLNDQQSRLNRQQEVIQGDVLRELRSSTQAAEVLRSTGFNLQFDPPEGIEESELNTVEKIFYSFQRRTYTSYVTTFISNYHSMSFQRSKLKRILERETHDLTGRVVFNEDGDVISIRILKGSPSEDVQDLFEKTLKDLKLPNPPRDLLRQDKQFVIYYRLKIN